MKRKEKNSKNKKNNGRAKLVIDVSGKKRISVIEYDIGKITEEEFKCLLNELSELDKAIKVTYYSSNEAIDKANSRDFWELVKLFFSRACNTKNKKTKQTI